MYPGCLYYLFHNVTVCSTCHFIPPSFPSQGRGVLPIFPLLLPPFPNFPLLSTPFPFPPHSLLHSSVFSSFPSHFSSFTCTFFSLHLYLFSPCFPSFLFSEFSSDSCLIINPSLSFLPSYLTSIPFSFSSYFSFIPQFTCLLSPPPIPF